MRLGSRAGNLLLLAGSVLATCAVLEACLRVYYSAVDPAADPRVLLQRANRSLPDVAPADCHARGVRMAKLGQLIRQSEFPDIIYELKPGITACAFEHNRVVVNGAGWRMERDIAREKPGGVFRILGLGDSQMFGQGVETSETYLAMLERKLAERGIRAEAINTAVPGYNTANEAAVLARRGVAYAPDLVVVGFVGNDLGLPAFLERPLSYATLRKSYLLDFVLDRLARIPLRRSRWAREGHDLPLENVPMEMRNDDVKLDLTRVPEEYRGMVGLGGFEGALARIRAAAGGVPVLVLGPFGNNEVPARKLEQIVRSYGFRTAIPSMPGGMTVSRRDPHASAAGHAWIADQLLLVLEREGLLPGTR